MPSLWQEMKFNPVFALWSLLSLDVLYGKIMAVMPRPVSKAMWQVRLVCVVCACVCPCVFRPDQVAAVRMDPLSPFYSICVLFYSFYYVCV